MADTSSLEATTAHCFYCFDVLDAQLKGDSSLPDDVEIEDVEWLVEPSRSIHIDSRSPLFVTWNTLSSGGDSRLRGCIGTFEPQPLQQGLRDYAITSAFRDRRFSPITSRELKRLECRISLLTDFEPCAHPTDWTLGVHGVYVRFPDPARHPPAALATPSPIDSPIAFSTPNSSTPPPGRPSSTAPTTSSTSSRGLFKLPSAASMLIGGGKQPHTLTATFLPDVAPEQGWDHRTTLEHAVRKAGWTGKIDDALLATLKVTRYQSSKANATYADWRAARNS